MDSAMYEFAEVEKILNIAEGICGPYVWGRYEFLVLPYSFPFGGMENPNMTFMSPTQIVGDRSLVTVLAHEIVHSWTGNLVTNVSWEHFWLNEGWTRFIEDKIKAIMEGDENVRKFMTVYEMKRMNDDFENFKDENKYELTSLVLNLAEPLRDPEDAFSGVPYEKGMMVLLYTEELMGGPDVFAPYIKDYMKTFKDEPVYSGSWLKHLLSFFPEKAETLKALPWDNIMLKPGPSVVSIDTTNPLTDKCNALYEKWCAASTTDDFDAAVAEFPDASTWTAFMKAEVLESLREAEVKWPEEKFNRFSQHLDVVNSKNYEILTPWLR